MYLIEGDDVNIVIADPWTGKTSMYGWQGNNPIEPENKGFDYCMVQGILGLYDCGPDDGGFHAVPGFQKHIQAWAEANEHLRERNTYPKIYDETTGTLKQITSYDIASDAKLF